MTALTAAATALEYGVHGLRRARPARRSSRTPNRAWLEALRSDGVLVVPGYFDKATCSAAIAAIDRVLHDEPDLVRSAEDQRIFGIEQRCAQARALAADNDILSLAEAIYGEPVRTAFVLGAQLDSATTTGGSGGGWHRDSFGAQCKAIVYLSDVTETNGPFQFIRGSHRLGHITRDLRSANLGFRQTRVEDDQVDALVRREPNRLGTYPAPAGTLILADTSALHRGAPIVDGTRYALTSYLFPTRVDDDAIKAKFEPLVPPA